jgi:ribose/xylose/arabinose/galactoside ABC-type transport system permease subunit
LTATSSELIPNTGHQRSTRRRLGLLLQAGSLIALVAVMIYFSIAAASFTSFGNVANVLNNLQFSVSYHSG